VLFGQVTLRLSSISRYYDLKGYSRYNRLKLRCSYTSHLVMKIANNQKVQRFKGLKYGMASGLLELGSDI
jgi:hypothetical protein